MDGERDPLLMSGSAFWGLGIAVTTPHGSKQAYHVIVDAYEGRIVDIFQ
jgi:predicted small secreted protein